MQADFFKEQNQFFIDLSLFEVLSPHVEFDNDDILIKNCENIVETVDIRDPSKLSKFLEEGEHKEFIVDIP